MKLVAGVFFSVLCCVTAQADETDKILQKGAERLAENQQAQESVASVHEQTAVLEEDYFSTLKTVDDLKIYNQLMQKQLDSQAVEVERLREAITNTAVIERQILPLLVRMLDGLESFVALDVPFLHEERKARVETLRGLITRSDISNAEKARRVFEAFQIETEYGNTIESYKEKLNLGEKTFDAEFLRLGRVAWAYRSVAGDTYGYWDMVDKQWIPVANSATKRNIDKGIRVARQEVAPELVTLPLRNIAEVSQ